MTTRTWRPNGPGSFQAPEDVTAVRDKDGRQWTREGTRWAATATYWLRWRTLVDTYGPLNEEAPPS